VNSYPARWCLVSLRNFSLSKKGEKYMKSAIIFTGTGPILILTTHESLTDPSFVRKLASKGVNKFVAIELPVDKVKAVYGDHFNVIMEDLRQTDDLRVLDYNGHHILDSFSLKEWGPAIRFEP